MEQNELGFIEKIVSLNRVAKVVKGGRRFSFSALMVVGDGNGNVGFGLGKAQEVPEALRKATEHARKNMVKVPLIEGTLPYEILGEFGAGRVMLKPASRGTGIIAGGAVRAVMEAAGVNDVLAKAIGTNNPHNVLRATMAGLAALRSADAVSEAQRKFMGTLWNTYAFYVLYAEIDGFDPTKHTLKRENLTPMDKWVLSRLNTLIKTVDSNLDGLHITEAGRELARFTDDLSNWYVRRCRERYWGSGMTDDKEAAYMTLYTVLATMSALCAPFTPFMSESIYQNIVRSVDKTAPESIHLCDFPVADESLIDAELERSMDEVLEIVVLGRAARAAANVKNRQPLARMFVQGGTLDALYTSIIADELNVKAVEFVNDASSFISYRVKPQLKTLGPRYGKLLPKINAYLAQDGIGDKVVAAHKAGNSYDFELEGTAVSLAEADVLTEPIQKSGFVSQTEKETAVVLDTNLTDELVDEGFVRELVSKIQVMRKEAGFEVTDRIALTYACVGRAKDVLSRFGDAIAQDVLAVSVSDAAPAGYVKEWDVNGEKVTLGVEKK